MFLFTSKWEVIHRPSAQNETKSSLGRNRTVTSLGEGFFCWFMKTGHLLPRNKLVLREGLALSPETSAMIRTVLDAVHEVSWRHIYFQRAEEDFTPEPVLRSLLTYCLAKGACGAQEIEAALAEDTGAEYLAANHRPKWETIHEFRRRNLDGLKD